MSTRYRSTNPNEILKQKSHVTLSELQIEWLFLENVNTPMLMTKDFIFIHIPKVAGTSIQRALAPHIPSSDPASNQLRKSQRNDIPGHITLRDLQNKVGKNEIDKRFVFAFVRNPWERMQSLYHYTIQHGKDRRWEHNTKRYKEIGLNVWILEEMESWITTYTKWHNKGQVLQQADWIRTNIDFVGRFENLQEDFNFVCNRLGFESELRQKLKTQHKHYTEEYNTEAKHKIETLFPKDIEEFKYTF